MKNIIEEMTTDPVYDLPLFVSRIRAGFPSPAEDDAQNRLDLNTYFIKHPAATFFVRVSGDSMRGAGIHDKDILIVDRSLTPVHGKIVIAAINGELTVKRLYQKADKTLLMPENNAFAPIAINAETVIWGVVTTVLHSV